MFGPDKYSYCSIFRVRPSPKPAPEINRGNISLIVWIITYKSWSLIMQCFMPNCHSITEHNHSVSQKLRPQRMDWYSFCYKELLSIVNISAFNYGKTLCNTMLKAIIKDVSPCLTQQKMSAYYCVQIATYDIYITFMYSSLYWSTLSIYFFMALWTYEKRFSFHCKCLAHQMTEIAASQLQVSRSL